MRKPSVAIRKLEHILAFALASFDRKIVRTDKASEGDILHACLDSGERRLILASSLGEILVYGYLQVNLSEKNHPTIDFSTSCLRTKSILQTTLLQSVLYLAPPRQKGHIFLRSFPA